MLTRLSGSNATEHQRHYLDTLKYWSIISAYGLAAAEGVRLTQEHIDIVTWLRSQFDDLGYLNEVYTLEQLAVMYGPHGGEKYLKTLFPKNLFVQSLLIAGLPVPENTQNKLALVN